MALVAYDDSDNDSNITDDEEDERSGNVLLVSKSVDSNNLFTSLPEPKSSNSAHSFVDTEEEQDEFLLKKEIAVEKPSKAPKRIVIPSLSSIQSDSDDDEPTKRQPISKNSGLFAMLPPPKGSPVTTKSFIPNVLKRKAPMVPKAATKGKIVKKQAESKREEQSDSDDDIVVEEFDANTWRQVCGRKQKIVQPVVSVVSDNVANIEVTTAPEIEKPYDGLDNDAFKKLVGSSKIVRENIKLIDVNEEAITEDHILRTKAMTDPNIGPKTAVEEPVSNIHKKKHHIMFLAEQAKANDLELQNQWSANRFSRKQTQAKYGF